MIRILFVDDEAHVLQAMRRSLHDMSNDWSMEFAATGAAALEDLAKTPADVIVADVRMPGMDGWQLLAEVKKRHPQTVRMILSGQGDPSCIMRCVGAAHQYLAKPWDTAALKTAISQTLRLRQLLGSERLARLIGRVGMLPKAPKAFREILACLQQPTAAIAEAARIISSDPAMTANVMKLVNSAFFGSRQPIATTSRAVAYLGLDTLGALVLGHSAFKSAVPTGVDAFSLARLWQHSLETAIAARTVARCEKLSPAQADEAFVAGMLHDVGKTMWATPSASGDPAPSAAAAAAQMEAHHAEVGAALLGSWGFPSSIVQAAAFHHAPAQSAGATGLCPATLIHIADRLVHQRRTECSGPFERGLEPELLAKLGLADRWTDWLAALDSLDFLESAA